MSPLTNPVEIAAVVAAVGWPFAAGLGLVLWSKVRARRRQAALAGVDASVRGLFENVQGKPTPERLTLVIEALEEAQAFQAGKPARKRRVAVEA